MKIPVKHIDLAADLGYEGYWVDVPRSIKEGFLRDFADTAGKDGSDENDSEQARLINMKILGLVTAWNIDDDEGNVYPIFSKIKSDKEKAAIIAELPVDVIVHIGQVITGSISIPEKTRDF